MTVFARSATGFGHTTVRHYQSRCFSIVWCQTGSFWLQLKTNLLIFLDINKHIYIYIYNCEPGSSVGIATDYGLDGPGSNPGGDEIFRPSRPALGPTQPPIKWVSEDKVQPGRSADHSPPSHATVMEE